jgi:hypothetical protein
MFKMLCVALAAFSFSVQASDFLSDPALQVREGLDELKFDHSDIKQIRGTDLKEAYWDILGNYPSKVKLFKRRMKFIVNCNPLTKADDFLEDGPQPPKVALSTIALGTIDNFMIKIIQIPPGTEEFIPWDDVSFISQKHITKICIRG